MVAVARMVAARRVKAQHLVAVAVSMDTVEVVKNTAGRHGDARRRLGRVIVEDRVNEGAALSLYILGFFKIV